MLEATSAISGIFKVAKLIYTQVQLVKANKAQCKRLAERVGIIEASIQGLEAIHDKSHYQTGLNDLLNGLNKSLAFIQKFTESGKWFKYVLKTGNYKEQFQALSKTLQESMQQLNLGLTAQQIINHEEDKKDQEVDFAFIYSNQEEIIHLNKEAIAGIQKISVAQKEGQDIIVQQLASMKLQIQALNLKAVTVKPLIESKYTVPYFELAFESKIGEGSVGAIYLGLWNEEKVAIKTIETMTPEAQEQFTREVQIMSQCRNKHITQFYGACLESTRTCFVMEYMDQGSLYQLLEKNPLSPDLQKAMALQIAKGLHYLHTQGILHRDLKSANILINAHHEAKLADFGLSKTKSLSVKTTHQRSQAIQWLAPECFEKNGVYTKASDIYSFGVILWEIVTGKKPYATLKEKEVIASMLKEERWEQESLNSLPSVYAELIQSCWQKNVSKRPSLESMIKTITAYQPRPVSPSPEERYNQGMEFERSKDFTKALQSYQKAFDKGHVKAETNLGLFFLHGLGGLSKDKKQAHEYFLKTANQGHVRAMVNLATMLKHGDGITQNLPEAMSWYKKAADLGDPHSKKEYEKLFAVLGSTPAYQNFNESFKVIAKQGQR